MVGPSHRKRRAIPANERLDMDKYPNAVGPLASTLKNRTRQRESTLVYVKALVQRDFR